MTQFATYSFTNAILTISGPGGAFTIGGPDDGSAEEGFTFAWSNETNVQSHGAAGDVMNSLISTRAGRCTTRLLKTSPVNNLLSVMFNFQRTSSANWGQNVITGVDTVRGDNYTGLGSAFVRFPSNSYARVGNMLDWEFDIAVLIPILGPGFVSFAA
jgi:hypothetical protein